MKSALEGFYDHRTTGPGKLRDLPPEKQKEVLDFVAPLEEKNGTKKPLRSLRGLWKDLNVSITEEDIAEARRKMWGNFPRDLS